MVVFSGINNAGDSGGRIGEEEDEFSYDLRLARRWKRRRIANENFGLNSCSNKALKKTSGQNDKNKDAFVESLTVDSEYGKFLNDKGVELGCGEFVNYMEGFVDFDGGCVSYGSADDSGDNVRDNFDPDYMMFLDNLKEDGESYVLDFALGEILVSVKYEKKDDTNNELEVENGGTRKCHSEQWRIRTKNILKTYLERERNETARRVFRSDKRRQHTVSPRINCMSNGNSWNRKDENPSKTLRSELKRKDNGNPSIMRDVEKRVKTEIPRTLRSNSRREDNKSSSILHDRLKREKVDSARTLRGDLRRESTRGQKNLKEPVLEKNAQKEAEDPVSSVKNGCSTKQRSQGASNSAKHQLNHVKSDLVDESYLEFLKLVKHGQHLECTPEGGKKIIYENSDSNSDLEIEKEAEDSVSFAKNGCSSRRHGPEATNSVKHQGKPGVESDLLDESYGNFLKSLKDGQPLEWISDGGKKVVYDEGDSDSEVTILENNPFSDGNHIPVVDLDGEECTETPGSEFREELMEILRKPYDRIEYEKLWKEASLQKPLEGHRVLRSNTKTYKLDSNGKSYLEREEYSDVALAVDQARGDSRRILNILRGFFYWLQNLAHKGVFKPWLDSSCLSILPPVELGGFSAG